MTTTRSVSTPAEKSKSRPSMERVDVLVEKLPETKMPTKVQVSRTYDGDTIFFKSTYNLPDAKTGKPVPFPLESSVRVQFVNTPEKRGAPGGGPEPWALEGAALTAKLVGETVQLSSHGEVDGYGRYVASVIDPRGESLAKRLIQQGFGTVYSLGEGGDPVAEAVITDLLAAQAQVRKEKKGVWSEHTHQSSFVLTSFHSNANGVDSDNLNGEYFRMVNVTNRTINVEDWIVRNQEGQEFKLPKVDVPAGHTLLVHSGKGKTHGDPARSLEVFLGSNVEIWNNTADKLELVDERGHQVFTRAYEHKQKDPATMPAIVKHTSVLNQFTGSKIRWTIPTIECMPKQVTCDDGDTVLVPAPAEGVIKVSVDGHERPVSVAKTRDTREGEIAIRMVGVDTPENHLLGTDANGIPFRFTQGFPADDAAIKLQQLLSQGTKIEVVPLSDRGMDPYGRILGTVWVTLEGGERINANQWMVEQGLGEMSMSYTEGFDPKVYKAFSDSTRQAVENGRGIWSSGKGHCDLRPVDLRRWVAGKMTPPPAVVDMEKKVLLPYSEVTNISPWNRLYVYGSANAERAVRDLGLTVDPRVPFEEEPA